MGCSEKEFCIRCDRGGKLLVCSESGCPIAVHEKCMGLPVKFDDRGNFYCAYCLYKRAIEETRKAMEDTMLKKQALTRFLENGDEQVQPSMRKSPSKRADKSSLEECTKRTNNPRKNNCDIHLMVAGNQTQSDPIVARGCESSDGHGTTQEFRSVQAGKRMQTEHEPVVDGQQLGRDVENQEYGCSSERPEREKEMLKRAKQMLVRDVEDHQEDCHLSEISEREKKIKKKPKLVIAANEPEVDFQLLDRNVEDNQEDDNLSEIPEREKKKRNKPKLVITANEPDVDGPQLARDVEDRQEDCHLGEIPKRKKKIWKIPKLVAARNEPEAHGHQLDRDVEDHEEDGQLSEIPGREKQIRSKPKQGIPANEPEVDGQQPVRNVKDCQEDCHLSEIPGREKKYRKEPKQAVAANEPEVDEEQVDRDVEDHQEDIHLSEIPEREKEIRKNAEQMLAESEPEIDGQLDRDVEDHQDDGHMTGIPEREKKSTKKGEQMLAENEPEIDGQQLDRDVEDHQEDGHLSEIPEREREIRKKSIQMQAEKNKNQSGGAEDEQMQGKVHQSAASLMNEEPEPQLHKRDNIRVKTNASTPRETEAVSRRSRRIMKKSETEGQPLNSDSKRRSSWKAYTTRKIPKLTEETSVPVKLKQAGKDSTMQRSPVPCGKRKRLMWSAEEEKMLKEGVHKFSEAGRNMPWRKVLEFGHDVFDGTRTPVDLKDKWRTLWGK